MNVVGRQMQRSHQRQYSADLQDLGFCGGGQVSNSRLNVHNSPIYKTEEEAADTSAPICVLLCLTLNTSVPEPMAELMIPQKAWKAACESKGAVKLVIPKGKYLIGPIQFAGPCKHVSSLTGYLRAMASLSKYGSGSDWIEFGWVRGLTLTGGGILDGQGVKAWPFNKCTTNSSCQLLPINLKFVAMNQTVIKDITSVNSKFFHIALVECRNFKGTEIKISAPASSPNTDGIHIERSSSVYISRSHVGTGDDCISIGQGNSDITITGITCGPGHGISVGSLGRYLNEKDVNGLVVRDCIMKETMNGIRIKTWADSPCSSSATNMTFENIVMYNVTNPIIIDQTYCPYTSCPSLEPSRVKLRDIFFKNIRGTSSSKVAVRLECSRGIPCRNIYLEDVHLDLSSGKKHATSSCKNVKAKYSGTQIPPPCIEFETECDAEKYKGGVLKYNPSTPPVCSRSSSLRKMMLPGELSPGLLDLHSFDTELIPQMPFSSLYDSPINGKSFDNSEPYLARSDRYTNKVRGLPDNNLPRSLSADKEKSSTVAKIKVVVRKRPLNKKEIAKKEDDIITIDPSTNSLTVHETKLKVDLTEYVEKHEFVFDTVLDEDVSNDEVYAETVQPIVPIIFQRTKATCFAYGQTGSGKTYTMQPLPLKASQDILGLMHRTYRNQGFQLHVSFFEIYGGKIFDLLNDRKKLCMREDGKQQVCIVGLQEYSVTDVDTIKEFIERGNATRSTGTTGANEESSRSHAILQLAVKRSANGSESKPARLVGKLSFIDLAGSERGADTTDNDKQTRMEGAEINKSLLALKECIRALDNDQGHIPFRGSKLTEVLRDSFVGDSRTVMISCISPSSGSCEHTLNTLRYADRVKSLSNGNGSKKDVLSSTSSLRDSTTLPLSSVLPTISKAEDNLVDVSIGSKRFRWSKPIERESSPGSNVERVPSGRIQGNVIASSLYTDNYKAQIGNRGDVIEDDFDYSESTYEQEKLSWGGGPPKTKYGEKIKENQHSDKMEGSLRFGGLQFTEEEDLVTAHRKQVEEMIDIVTEEMDLLVIADQPGNQLDDYISRLKSILSQKAAGIVQLQTRLAHFQRRLEEHNILVSSATSADWDLIENCCKISSNLFNEKGM
ncbi:Kinesin motor domain, partial [Dillenia turbinata]